MINPENIKCGWDRVGICYPTDIVHVKTPNHWMSWATRQFERHKGENPSWASHTGMIASHGMVIEALWRVTERVLRTAYEGQSHIVVTRVPALSDISRAKVLTEIRSHLGQKYGWWNLIKHSMGRKDNIGNPNRPICSYLVANAFDTACGYKFGVPANEAQPDDIMDYCIYNNHQVIWCSSLECKADLLHVYGDATYAAELIKKYEQSTKS